jgi:hypothetical protein
MGWYNNDGLYIKYGTEEAQMGVAGEYNMAGPQQMIELTISAMTALGTTAAIQEENVVVPKNARIEKVEVITTTACTSGGSATLNIGLIRTDRSTELDYDGFVAALALASFNAAGETVALTNGSTSAGALIGTTLSNNGYLTADYDTAAFTAGAIKVRIYFTRG